jgi:hypothetical protein
MVIYITAALFHIWFESVLDVQERNNNYIS